LKRWGVPLNIKKKKKIQDCIDQLGGREKKRKAHAGKVESQEVGGVPTGGGGKGKRGQWHCTLCSKKKGKKRPFPFEKKKKKKKRGRLLSK